MGTGLLRGVAVAAGGGRALGSQGQWRIMLGGAETGGEVTVVDAVIPPGFLIPPHARDREADVTRVLKGNLVIGDDILDAPEGTVVFRPRGVMHAVWNLGPGVAMMSSVCWPAGVEAHLDALASLTQQETFDRNRMEELSKAHGVRYDLKHGAELAARYGLRMPG